MILNLKSESTLTDRYQTTIPEVVRQTLKLNKGDKLQYCIKPNGDVVLSRVEISSDNIDLDWNQLIDRYGQDIANHPDRDKLVAELDEHRRKSIQKMTKALGIDIGSKITSIGTLLPPPTSENN